MDSGHFDHIARLFGRRFTRRAAIAAGGAGLAAAELVRDSVPARVQEATPAATAVSDAEFLFVQTFSSGTWTPIDGPDHTHVLTLTGNAAQTVYFSDRPERYAGVVPTQAFLDGLGFSSADPPNAAVVAVTDAGEDVLVVELFNPTYDETVGTLAYEARVLGDYGEEGLAHLAARQTDAGLPASFGPASLFIDDCPDGSVSCFAGIGDAQHFVGSIGPMGYCWDLGEFCCHPCQSADADFWSEQCNATFSECGNGCNAQGVCMF